MKETISHSARLRYIEQLEAHMDEDGKTGPNNIRDLIQLVRDAEESIAALTAERDEARAERMCNACRLYSAGDSTCHAEPPIRLPRKFADDATPGNRARVESLLWGWPSVSADDWCGRFQPRAGLPQEKTHDPSV